MYVELESDHAMTAFLAGLTTRKVLRDRSAAFTPVERKRAVFLRQKTRQYKTVQRAKREETRQSEIRIAMQMAREMSNTKEQTS